MTDVLDYVWVESAYFMAEFWPYAAFFVGFALAARIASIRLSRGRDRVSVSARSTGFSGSSWGEKGSGMLREYQRDQSRRNVRRRNIDRALNPEGGGESE